MDKKITLVIAAIALVSLGSLASAVTEDMCICKAEVRNQTEVGTLLGTYYSNSACCPDSLKGVSSSAANVNPGSTLCYRLTFHNNGDTEIMAKNYWFHTRPLSQVTGLNAGTDSSSDPANSVMPREGGGLLPDESIELWACDTIYNDVAPGLAWLHGYLIKVSPPSTYSSSWYGWGSVLNLLEGPASTVVTMSYVGSEWDPADSYDAVTGKLDLEKLSGKANSDIVHTRSMTVSNAAGSKGSFSGRVYCNNYPGGIVKEITNLAPGNSVDALSQWAKSVFSSTPAGRVDINCCLYDKDWHYLTCDWGGVSTFSSDAGALVIGSLGTDKVAYESGQGGTLEFSLYNNGGDLGDTSTVDLSLTDDATGTVVLSPITLSLGPLSNGQSKTASTSFTVPSSLAFMNTFTLCADIKAVKSDNTPFSSLTIWSGWWAGTTGSRYCLQVTPTTSNEAACSDLSEVGIPKQNCTCASRYCTIEAPPGMWMTNVEYEEAIGRGDNLEDRRILYLVNAQNIPIKIEYMKGVVPSLDLSLLALVLLVACAAFFYLSPHRPQARK